MTAPHLSTFEAWNAARPKGEEPMRDGKCTCCGERVALEAEGYCEPCLHKMYATDCEEARMVDVLIGGAVKAALRDSVSEDLIVVAVHRAIRQVHDEWADSQARHYAEVARLRRVA